MSIQVGRYSVLAMARVMGSVLSPVLGGVSSLLAPLRPTPGPPALPVAGVLLLHDYGHPAGARMYEISLIASGMSCNGGRDQTRAEGPSQMYYGTQGRHAGSGMSLWCTKHGHISTVPCASTVNHRVMHRCRRREANTANIRR